MRRGPAGGLAGPLLSCGSPPRETPPQKGPITRYGQASRVGAGTFREPINILIAFCACLRPDLDICFPFRIKSEIPAMRHENKKRVHLPAEHRGVRVRPHSVSRDNWTQPPACILPVVYRRPLLVSPASPPLPHRLSGGLSSRRGLHFGVARRERHNMRLSHLCGGLSAGAPAAYHGPPCRAEPGHRGAARRRVRALPAAPLSIGSGQ